MRTRLYQMFLKVNKTDDGIPEDKDPIILWGTRGAGNITFFAKVASGQPGTWAMGLISRLVLVIMLLSKGQKASQRINSRCMSHVYRNGACFQAQNQRETPFLRIQHSLIYAVKPQRNKSRSENDTGCCHWINLEVSPFQLTDQTTTLQNIQKVSGFLQVRPCARNLQVQGSCIPVASLFAE